MKQRISGNEYRTTILCVDSYKDSILQGRFFNPYDKNGQTFTCAADFLVKMENMLDKMNFPQAFNAIRSFTPVPAVQSDAPETSTSGKVATFGIKDIIQTECKLAGIRKLVRG